MVRIVSNGGMMHTLILKTETKGEFRIHHNSDWSGNVFIVYNHRDIELPGEIIIAVAKKVSEILERLGEKQAPPEPE